MEYELHRTSRNCIYLLSADYSQVVHDWPAQIITRPPGRGRVYLGEWAQPMDWPCEETLHPTFTRVKIVPWSLWTDFPEPAANRLMWCYLEMYR